MDLTCDGRMTLTHRVFTHPYDRERVPLLVVQVLLDVEESVKEDVGQLAPLEIPQGYLIYPM